MGVPKFYRWISERYPKINQVITDSALLPEFDHLYLDMNGIIHGCTHPSHLDVADSLSEKDMLLGIMHYIDRIVSQIVKPKVSLYMAIDGVAPRAKLNQQRSRRFRSAQDLIESTKNSKKNSLLGNNNSFGKSQEELDSRDTRNVFDSNCITPGTEFMARVSNAIKYYIRKKIKDDPIWRNLKVIFSGHEVPGEGEHKIMQHIRNMKNVPDYQPNTRHCMYGQDADLIMLGLVSHEPHFTLLREIVDFGGFHKNKNELKTVKKFTKQSDFQLLHLSILREYLELEFSDGIEKDSYDVEAIIDDFVFMTFLVGNDFLPHMPSLDIGENAFDLLFTTYKEQRATWGKGEYLTQCGKITDPVRLEKYFSVIGDAETKIFEEREINEGIYLKKKRRWDKRDGKAEGPTDEEIAEQEDLKQQKYMDMINELKNDELRNSNIELPTTDEKDFKGRYYFEKLNFKPVDLCSHLALRQAYMEGLIWCLAYYYRGCISWGWFYPYHYGPLLSDLKDLTTIFENIKFDIGAPLKPFEQLMGCLPPASSTLVPKPYRKLMCSPDSPIKKFYPETFKVDMNGKRNPWEGVNLLPFIDIDLLRKVINENCPDMNLTVDERKRNTRGDIFCYTHDLTSTGTVPSCNRSLGLPDINCCYSRVDVIDEPDGTDVSFKSELIPGTKIPYPGFPSLNVIPITSNELNKVGLNCFGSASKYSTRVLHLHKLPQLPSAAVLADKVLGSSVYINWPMMHEAKVVSVSDSTCEVKLVKRRSHKTKMFKPEETKKWESESETLVQQYQAGNGIPGSGGVNIGDIQIRLKLRPLQGLKSSPLDGSTKKIFGKEEAVVPLQMVLWQSPAPDPRFCERGPLKLQDRFPTKTNVLLTKGKYRGCLASVLGVVGDDKIGVKVEVIPPEPPFGLAIAQSMKLTYISSQEAAKLLQMKPTVFGRITGNINFDPGRYDLGLNLKYKDDLCVPGYARKRMPDERRQKNKTKTAWSAGDSLLVVGSNRGDLDADTNNRHPGWEFTPEAIRLVAAYRQKFPQIFAWVNRYPNERFYDAKKVFGPNCESMLATAREWLNDVETAKLPRSPSSTISMSLAATAAIQRAADVRHAAQVASGPAKEANIKVPPSSVFAEGSVSPTSVLQSLEYNDGSPPELGDRIANLCADGLVFGARGTVVGIHGAKSGCVEVIMDEEFIGGSSLQGSCSNFRGKLCVWDHLLKITAVDSKDIVEKIIPSSMKSDTNQNVIQEEKEQVIENSTENTEPAKNNITPSRIMPRLESKNIPNKTNSRSNGSGNRGGKQGVWKEALGPQANSKGFHGMNRRVENGFKAWHKLVTTSDLDFYSVGLKSMLGVNADTHSSSDATASLKAKLGVGVKTELPVLISPQQIQSSELNNSNGLMPTSAPTTQAQNSATSALEEIMRSTSFFPPAHSSQMNQAQLSNFNFTYLQEGEKPTTIPISSQQSNPRSPLIGSAMMAISNGVHATQVPQFQGMHNPTLNESKKTSTVPRGKKSPNVMSEKNNQGIVPSVVATRLKR